MMIDRLWRATRAGCRPAPDLALAPDQMSAIRDSCRAGSIVITARSWRADLYVDPIAQAPGRDWSMSIEASLTGRGSTFVLHVLCGDAWQSSPHDSTAELLAALTPWVDLAGDRLGLAYRLAAPGDAAATESPGAATLRARHRWLTPLLADLAGTAIGSARDLLDLAARHGDAREALVVRLGSPAPGRLAVVEHVDHACNRDTRGALGLPRIEHWLQEAAEAGRFVVSESEVSGRSTSVLTVVLPTIQRGAHPSPHINASAVWFQLITH